MPIRALRSRPSSRAAQDAGIPNNTVLIFSELMDAKSAVPHGQCGHHLFLRQSGRHQGTDRRRDTAARARRGGRHVVQWVTDFGLPGPDRGEGGKYLFVPPDYKGELPGSGYFVQKMRTTRATMLGRAFLEKNDPKPVVAGSRRRSRSIPTFPADTARASARRWKVRRRSRARRNTNWTGPFCAPRSR